ARSSRGRPSDHLNTAARRRRAQPKTSAVAQCRGQGLGGEPSRPTVWPTHSRRRPLADRGSPGRTHGNAVTNPRIRVCSTVVLTALPPAPRTRSILPQPVPDNGIAHPPCVGDTRYVRVW